MPSTANKFYLVGPGFEGSVSAYSKAFSGAGMSVQVEACNLEWGITQELLRSQDCLGGVICDQLASEALSSVDIAAASARIAGGVTLVACKAGKLMGLNTVGAAVAAAVDSMGVSLAGAQVCVLGTSQAARSCVLSLSQSGADAVAMLGEDKEATQEVMQDYLQKMERVAYATMMLGKAEDGKRNLLDAYEQVEFKFGSIEGSAATLADSALIVDARDSRLPVEAGEDAAIISLDDAAVCVHLVAGNVEAIVAIHSH